MTLGTLNPDKIWQNWKSYNPEKIWRENHTDLSTSPVRCSHFTLGNPKKSFSTVLYIHTSDYLRYLRRKQTVIDLPTPPEMSPH